MPRTISIIDTKGVIRAEPEDLSTPMSAGAGGRSTLDFRRFRPEDKRHIQSPSIEQLNNYGI
jgi:hypothetical protein